LYFSNLICGTSSGAGLGAGFCVCGLAAGFVELCEAGCEEAGLCPAESIAKIRNAAPSNKTRLSNAFIKFPFNGYASIPIDAYRWTTLAGVPEEHHLAYMGSEGVQAFCLMRYFDGQRAPAFCLCRTTAYNFIRRSPPEGSRFAQVPQTSYTVSRGWAIASCCREKRQPGLPFAAQVNRIPKLELQPPGICEGLACPLPS
jgi:hypothetical protein